VEDIDTQGGTIMNRRSFLTAWLGLLLPAWMRPAGARPAPARVFIQESSLAGFQYHHGERLWPWLHAGQPLTLAREPGNPHDRRAVRVDWRGRKLGYLPRTENAAVSQMLDRGTPLTARILRLRESRSPWGRVRVVVELSKEEA
jgi:hypothetical protein